MQQQPQVFSLQGLPLSQATAAAAMAAAAQKVQAQPITAVSSANLVQQVGPALERISNVLYIGHTCSLKQLEEILSVVIRVSSVRTCVKLGMKLALIDPEVWIFAAEFEQNFSFSGFS